MHEQIIDRAKHHWNKEADAFNQWESLDLDERIRCVEQVPLQVGDVVYSLKSGNRVRILYDRQTDWLVERLDGHSQGKQLQLIKRTVRWCIPGNEEDLLAPV